MKKRTLILLVLGACLCLAMTACATNEANDEESDVMQAAYQSANLATIDGKEQLAYDRDTRVVYYMFSAYRHVGYQGYGYGYMSPYISENGNYCRYVNDQIVEITEEDTTNN